MKPKTGTVKKFISLLMAAAMAFTLLPVTVLAAQGSDFVVSENSGYAYNSAGVLTFYDAGDYTVSMAGGVTSTSTDKIVVNGGTQAHPVNITLSGVTIDQSSAGGCAFELQGTSYVNLTLFGTNSLKSGKTADADYAGLQVPDGTTVTITGGSCDSLTATGGGYYSAGIGGSGFNAYTSSYDADGSCDGGTITITGGTVTAIGSFCGSGIGGGAAFYSDSGVGNGGTVNISGGTVTATGGTGGAGIGGGMFADGGTVNISGGTVTATGDWSAGIGGGSYYGSGGTVNISGGTVTATGGSGAGIGSGFDASGRSSTGGTVTISGGTVTATGGSGAGIGGGYRSAGGAVYISGGSVYARSDSGEAIGRGDYDTGCDEKDSGTLQNNSTDQTDVYLATVTLTDGNGAGIAGAAIASLNDNLIYGFGDVATDSNGRLYLYLPEGSADLLFSDGTYKYVAALAVSSAETNAVTMNDLSSTCVSITSSGTYVLTGRTNSNRIIVNGGTNTDPVDITLSGVHIEQSSSGGCPFELEDGSYVNLTLSGTNSLKSENYRAGLQAPDGTTVNITGGASDSLESTGVYGAGIGGGYNVKGGTVKVTGGRVTAASTDGAGIGGGYGAEGGTVTIFGGTVAATGYSGAGIGGGGYTGGGGTVTIFGGTVTATGYSGAGIGGGYTGDGGTVYISGGSVCANSIGGERIGHGGTGGSSGTLQKNSTGHTDVYLTAVTLTDGNGGGIADAAITSLNGLSYGFSDVKTDSSGKLYLYLPAESTALLLSDGTYKYVAALTVSSSGTSAVTANDLSSTSVSLTSPGTYVLTGSTSSNKVTVNGGTETGPVNVTLSGVSIDRSSADGCAFELQGSSYVDLTLSGINSLTSGGSYAGLQVPSGSTLTITGENSDSLTATGTNGAGIGGGDGSGGTISISGGRVAAASTNGAGIGGGDGDGGTVNISGGRVTAASTNGAGIGGGGSTYGGDGGTVNISGGTVTATGGAYGAGIGGTFTGDGGTVYISGGSVYTYSDGGERIGHGSGGSDSGTLKNNGTDLKDVCLTTVTLDEISAETAVSSLTADLSGAAYTYGANDMQTDTSGKLYLYLPDTAVTSAALAGTGSLYSGSVTTTTDNTTSKGRLYLSRVSGISPSGTGAAVSGNIAVTFSLEMDDSASGAVSLDGGNTFLPDGEWSEGNTVYTAPYSGLSYGTSYNVAVSGFEDIYGNTIQDDSHSFTTLPSSDAALSGLTVSEGSLSPAFDSGKYAYTVSVGNSVTSLTVTPVTADAGATVKVNGTAAPGGAASGPVSLAVGENTVTIVVTAQDGNTAHTYTIAVTRAQGSGGGGSSLPLSDTTATTITGTTDLFDITTATITSSMVDSLVNAAKRAEANGEDAVIEIKMESASEMKSAVLTIPAAGLFNISENTDAAIMFDAGIASVTFDADAVDSISGAAGSMDISISITEVDISSLSAEAQRLIGTRPVYDFSITTRTNEVSNFGGGSAEISLPYTIQDGEDADALVMYHIDDTGALQTKSEAYDEEANRFSAETPGFSKYAIGYNPVSFTDVGSGAWYYAPVTFCAARGITNGTSATVFSPDTAVTRGQFITILYRISGDTGSYTNTFSDVPSGEWYENAAAWAQANGIAGGVGDSRFDPDAAVTREQLAVMLYNYAKYKGCNVSTGGETNILSYNDALDITDYAYPALQWACGEGIINGDNLGNLKPKGFGTRAEGAAMLQRFIDYGTG